MRHLSICVVALLVLTTCADADLRRRTIEYKHDDVVLQGHLVYDPGIEGKRPGVLVVHEWWGLNDYARRRADEIAKLGYVAFAVDMYGEGKVTDEMQHAAAMAKPLHANRALMRQRARAGLEVLRRHELVDPDRIAAIGYCFGGTTVLELARAGENLRGVVSFHGALVTDMPAQPGAVRARVLVLTGADDPGIPPEQVLAFEDEMRRAKVDFRVVAYPGAVHSFTVPEADKLNVPGLAYHEEADRKSWEEMTLFFEEIFRN